jgi:hypothetical protein
MILESRKREKNGMGRKGGRALAAFLWVAGLAGVGVSPSALADSFRCTKTLVWMAGASKGNRVSGVPCPGQPVIALNIQSASAAFLRTQCGAVGAQVEQLMVQSLTNKAVIGPVNCPAAK